MKINHKMHHSERFHYFHPFKPQATATSSMRYSFTMKMIISTLNASSVALMMLFFGMSASVHGQFWIENFGNDAVLCESQGATANGFVTANGAWNEEIPGLNGPLSNQWFVSAAEGSLPPGSCSFGCPGGFILARTLHLGMSAASGAEDEGAIYSETGIGISETDKRAVSPVIDCSGQFSIDLTIEFINTASPLDFCTIEYFDGLTWTLLLNIPNSPIACLPARTWDDLTVALPASANNNSNVQLGFRWRNADDGLINQTNFGHSVAIGNMALDAGPPPALPVASFFTNASTSFCETNCIQFFSDPTFDPGFSTGLASATYSWTFPGGNPASSTAQNPTVCYNTPGIYNVEFIVTDNVGSSAPFIETGYIQVLECGPDVAISTNIFTACAIEECFNFSDLSTGNNVNSWLWTFTSPSGAETTSNVQNPSGICLSEPGFYDVTLLATDSEGSSQQTFVDYVEVIDCTGPEVDFSASRLVICPGQCIELTDLSSSNFTIFAWNWTLPGGQAQGEGSPGVSGQQNPTVCYDNPGVYNITLSTQDQEGVSAITKTISITVDPCTGPPQVGINSNTIEICTGDCVDYFSESLGLVEEYLWIFQGVANVIDAVSTEANPGVICYNTPGTYNVTLTVSNSFGQIDSQVFTDYLTVNQCLNAPTPRIELNDDTICAGKCITFSNASTGLGITGQAWSFQGGNPTSSTAANPVICYNNPGSYSVSLTVNGAGGDSSRVFQNVVTVQNGIACRPQISVNVPDTICATDCAFFSGTFAEADSVSWTFIGGVPEQTSAAVPGIICYGEEGEYPVIVEAFNLSGAASPVVTTVVVLPRPPLSAGPDITINAGTVVTLEATISGNNLPLGDFEWAPFDLVNNFRNPKVKTSPKETTVYIVSYQEAGGCKTNDSITVFVNFNAAVGVPNVFSPNGDGQNDVLSVLGQGIARMEFRIYNRYGQMVFETTEQSLGWDGTQNGRDLNPGTFVWVLDVRFAEGNQERFTGDVTLVR
jgi:gliding motility-associated-like protein